MGTVSRRSIKMATSCSARFRAVATVRTQRVSGKSKICIPEETDHSVRTRGIIDSCQIKIDLPQKAAYVQTEKRAIVNPTKVGGAMAPFVRKRDANEGLICGTAGI